eukprot:m.305978 g.305978  ORF g.305978 m.305978 type:complete len:500 (+) comp18391_c0_seq1:33-1532(+)
MPKRRCVAEGAARRGSRGVDVCSDEPNWRRGPQCAHGPGLLFVRYAENGSRRRFWACSACRDRRDCPLLVWAPSEPPAAAVGPSDANQGGDESGEHEKSADEEEEEEEDSDGSFDDGGAEDVPPQFPTAPDCQIDWALPLDEQRALVCRDCGTLAAGTGTASRPCPKSKHHVTQAEGASALRPTALLAPLDNDKKNAQYLFAAESVNTTLTIFRKLKLRNILCIGAPRIHEAVQVQRLERENFDGEEMDSFLLDLDARFGQWYPPRCFALFNMFNGFFFEDIGRKAFAVFATRCDAIVIDPPFGGVMPAFAATMQELYEQIRNARHEVRALSELPCPSDEIPTLLFFPYFNEKNLAESLPWLSMSDFCADYDNHPLYKASKLKKGSPVRAYTNIPGQNLVLPAPAYRFCKPCKRYVSATNVHCRKCKTCPSKDGSTYRHCDQCGLCVKPKRVHCARCGMCLPADHECNALQKPGVGVCHICGMAGHKRRDCPERQQIVP